MKKEFVFKYADGKFILTNKEEQHNEIFSISVDSLQFDTKKFYEGLFLDVNECIQIEIINECNFDRDDDINLIKKARHVFESISMITNEICTMLNEQCFTSDK